MALEKYNFFNGNQSDFGEINDTDFQRMARVYITNTFFQKEVVSKYYLDIHHLHPKNHMETVVSTLPTPRTPLESTKTLTVSTPFTASIIGSSNLAVGSIATEIC